MPYWRIVISSARRRTTVEGLVPPTREHNMTDFREVLPVTCMRALWYVVSYWPVKAVIMKPFWTCVDLGTTNSLGCRWWCRGVAWRSRELRVVDATDRSERPSSRSFVTSDCLRCCLGETSSVKQWAERYARRFIFNTINTWRVSHPLSHLRGSGIDAATRRTWVWSQSKSAAAWSSWRVYFQNALAAFSKIHGRKSISKN